LCHESVVVAPMSGCVMASSSVTFVNQPNVVDTLVLLSGVTAGPQSFCLAPLTLLNL
jgi:hypothetical protein